MVSTLPCVSSMEFRFEVSTDSRLPRLADFSVGTLCWSIVLLYKLFPSERPL